MSSELFTVIVTHNAKKWLKTSLCSLFESTNSTNIVIVDNASTDETVFEIESTYPNIKIIRLNKNIGFGRANNEGISYALRNGAEHIFLMNQDVEIEVETIQILMDLQSKNPEYGVCSPMHLNGERSYFDIKFSKYCLSGDKVKKMFYDHWFNMYVEDLKEQNLDLIYEVDYINAAAWMLHRNCLKVVGGFHPIFFLYGEDDEYLNRMKNRGFKVGLVPSTTIRHHRNQKVINHKDKSLQEQLEHFDRSIKILLTNKNLPDNKKRAQTIKHLFKGVREKYGMFNYKFIKSVYSRLVLYQKIKNSLKKISAKNGDYQYLDVSNLE